MRLSLLATAVLFFGSSLAASADTVYTYTGGQLYFGDVPFSTNNYIRGEFTTSSPLTPNAWNNEPSSIISSEFTDGNLTLDNRLSGNFYVDGAGQITDWTFFVSLIGAPYQFDGSSQPTIGPPDFYDADYFAYDCQPNCGGSGFSYTKGTFTTSPTPSSVTPEPPALLLLATGMLGLLCVFHHRSALFLGERHTEHTSA